MRFEFLIILILSVLIFAGCSKTEDRSVEEMSQVKMKYKCLGNLQIPFQKTFSYDLDDDGKKDLFITSQLIGKPSEQSDYQSYYFMGGSSTYSPIDVEDQTPVLNAGDIIGEDMNLNHEWYNVPQVCIAEKIIPISGNDYWQGKWKNVSHKYLAFALKKDGKYTYGWLELSFSKNLGTVILHCIGFAEESGKNVIAGK